MTKISLQTSKNLERFVCTNEKGHEIVLGTEDAVGPMQSVLMAIAGCSTIDIIMILKKMRQDVKDIKVDVEGQRVDTVPKVFNNINIHYIIIGDVKKVKAEEAIKLSLEKYCSVSLMISKSAKITHSFEVLRTK